MIKMLKTTHNTTAICDQPFMTPADLSEVAIALPRHYSIGRITYTPATDNGTTSTLVVECDCVTENTLYEGK